MVQHSYDIASQSRYALLLIFEWGEAPNVRRYARETDPVTIADGRWAGTYQSLMPGDTSEASVNTEINLGKQSGGTEDDPVEIDLPAFVEPVKWLVQPYEWAPVTVHILECDPTNPDETLRHLYTGTASEAIGNAEGNRGVARLILVGPKAQWKDIRLGLAMGEQCNHPEFGRGLCGFDLDSATLPGTVLQTRVGGDPHRIMANFPGAVWTNEWWSNGQVIVDGLAIKVRSIESPGVLNLARMPPPMWAGQPATGKPGCDRTIDQCRFWDQEETFRGLGGMPYNPLSEEAN